MNSFRNRILLTFLFITLSLMSILGISHHQTVRQVTLTNFEGTARTITQQVAQRAVLPVFAGNIDQLNQIASEAFLITNLSCLSFFDDQKKLLKVFHNGKCPYSVNEGGALDTVVPFSLRDQSAMAVFPIILGELKIDGREEKRSGRNIGYVNACFSLEEISRELNAVTWNFLFLELVIALVIGFLILFLERWVSKPLVQLTEKVHRISQGDLSTRVDVLSDRDEIGILGTNINLMAEALERHTNHLKDLIQDKTREIEVRERQMMFQEKMASLGLMSANIAHEINNPLNYISLGLDFLNRREEHLRASHGQSFDLDAAEREKVFADIRHGFGRMKAIVDSLRKFSRTDETQVQEYSFREVFEDAHRIFQYELKNSGVQLETHFQENPKVTGSTVRLQQILLNFFRNSLDAFIEGQTPQPRIHVETREREGKLQVLFQDNGPGIPPEHQARIFEPFFTTKPPGKGTGLGLALCFELAAREGGMVKFEAGNLGGAAFTITLPLRNTSIPSPHS